MDDIQYIADIENLEIADEPVQRRNRVENLNPFESLSDHQFCSMLAFANLIFLTFVSIVLTRRYKHIP